MAPATKIFKLMVSLPHHISFRFYLLSYVPARGAPRAEPKPCVNKRIPKALFKFSRPKRSTTMIERNEAKAAGN